MANTKIQIKRSTANAAVSGLSNGELAYTQASNTLWIGLPDGSGVAAIGGVRNPGVLTANQALVANSTSAIDKVIVANAALTSIYANGSSGSAGNLLYSNGTATYWAAPPTSAATPGGTDTQVQFNDGGAFNGDAGFTYNKTTDTVAVTNITANGAGLTSVNAATVGGNTAATLIARSDAAYSNAMSDTLSRNGSYTGNNTFGGTNTVFTSNVSVSGRLISSLNPGTDNSIALGNSSLRYSSISVGSVNATAASFSGSVSVTGDLVVSGNVTATDVSSVVVSDPIIVLAANNPANSLDSGFVSRYNDGTVRYTGLARRASTGGYVLFANTTQDFKGGAISATVDTGATGYTLGTLQTYLSSGAFTSNGTAITLTANSTYSVNAVANAISVGSFVSNATALTITANSTSSVALVANTLSLATALSGTNGGTGQSTYTNQDLLVANTTNGLNKLSVGADGTVLQVNSTTIAWGGLDAGTF